MAIDPQLELEVDLLHSRVCQALADPKRVLILYLLTEGPQCVGELVDALDLPQSTVSRHLGILRERDLVQAERKGACVYYTLTDRRIIDALDIMRKVLAAQVATNADAVQSTH
ncbi:MAG: winged helix-turn-helix transcriptional regulator [Anaerolineae bacterium]|nr:winged helix-turn-helix transcriptional regulator [Anaerolineae bacterium]